MGDRSRRHILRKSRVLYKDTSLLLKRGRKTLSEEIQDKLNAQLDELKAAISERDTGACERCGKDLEPLIETHLMRYRKGTIREYAESIGLAVFLALLLRAFVVEAFQIPSESMVPTLLIGDHLFVNKFIYGVRLPFTRYDLIEVDEPERGEVVVFIFPVEEVRTQDTIRDIMSGLSLYASHHGGGELPQTLELISQEQVTDGWGQPFRYVRNDPSGYSLHSAGLDGIFDTSDDITAENSALRPELPNCLSPDSLEVARDYIKRVIGVAGDRVRVEDNIVYVNDEPLEQQVINQQPVRDVFGRLISRVEAYEQIGDSAHLISYVGRDPDFAEIVVKEGHAFVMGDNRDNSSDGRCWGQVPVANIKGEALFLFWSGGDENRLLGNRWERMFQGVN